MTKEQAYFLRVIKDFLGNEKTIPEKELNWTEIYEIAQKHQLGGIVFCQCKAFLPESVRPLFEKAYVACLFYYMAREEALQRISSTFQEAGIPYFIVKGDEVAKYYPAPALRTMGDQDIVIKGEDRQKANDIMLKLGYTKTTYWNNKEMGFSKDAIGIELHDHLIYEQIINRTPLEAFFENYWPYVKDGKLDVSFHFLYLLLHLRKHFMNSGVGFRMFIDLAVMSAKEPDLDWPWITARLDELDMLAFASCCFAFIREWFGIPSPLNEKRLDAGFYEDATAAVFANGVFGYDNKENNINEAVNVARQGGVPIISMTKRAVSFVFPSYSMMKNNENYHFIKGKAWLLPAAWIYRIYRAIQMVLGGRRNVLFHFSSSEELKKRDEFLKKWGL